jgi:hypothetical protein
MQRLPDRQPLENQANPDTSQTTKPSETKQIQAKMLGFICPNRDFSMGYERKK